MYPYNLDKERLNNIILGRKGKVEKEGGERGKEGAQCETSLDFSCYAPGTQFKPKAYPPCSRLLITDTPNDWKSTYFIFN